MQSIALSVFDEGEAVTISNAPPVDTEINFVSDDCKIFEIGFGTEVFYP